MIRFSRRFPKRSNEHAKVLTIGRRVRCWKRGIWLSWQEMNKCMFIFCCGITPFPPSLLRIYLDALMCCSCSSRFPIAIRRWRNSFSLYWTSNPHYVELSSASYSKLRFTSRPFLIWSKAKGGKVKGWKEGCWVEFCILCLKAEKGNTYGTERSKGMKRKRNQFICKFFCCKQFLSLFNQHLLCTQHLMLPHFIIPSSASWSVDFFWDLSHLSFLTYIDEGKQFMYNLMENLSWKDFDSHIIFDIYERV